MPEVLLEQLRKQSEDHYKAASELRERVRDMCEELHRFRDRILGDGNGAESLRAVVKRNEEKVSSMGNWIQDEITRRKAFDEIDIANRVTRQKAVDAANRRTKVMIAMIGVLGPAITLTIGKLVGT